MASTHIYMHTHKFVELSFIMKVLEHFQKYTTTCNLTGCLPAL